MNTQTPVVEVPVVEKPVEKTVVEHPTMEQPMPEATAAEQGPGGPAETQEERTWSEEFELAGNQLVEQVQEWIEAGNVRRLILRTPDNSFVVEIPLMAGAVVGGMLTIFAPLLAVVGAIASVLARVTVEVVRVEEPTPKEPTPKA